MKTIKKKQNNPYCDLDRNNEQLHVSFVLIEGRIAEKFKFGGKIAIEI